MYNNLAAYQAKSKLVLYVRDNIIFFTILQKEGFSQSLRFGGEYVIKKMMFRAVHDCQGKEGTSRFHILCGGFRERPSSNLGGELKREASKN